MLVRTCPALPTQLAIVHPLRWCSGICTGKNTAGLRVSPLWRGIEVTSKRPIVSRGSIKSLGSSLKTVTNASGLASV